MIYTHDVGIIKNDSRIRTYNIDIKKHGLYNYYHTRLNKPAFVRKYGDATNAKSSPYSKANDTLGEIAQRQKTAYRNKCIATVSATN